MTHAPRRFSVPSRGLAVAASLAAAVLVAGLHASPAAAGPSHASCTGFIDSVPAQIITPGTWCLRANHSGSYQSGNSLQASGPGIVIDCNGFRLQNVGEKVGNGIVVTGDDAVVRNCEVRGFATGIYVYGLRTVVENNRLSDLGAAAIYSQGQGSRVIGNHIRDVGLTGNGSATAIVAYGIADVSHNFIDGVRPLANDSGHATATGMWLYISQNGQVTGNRIRGLARVGASGTIYGIDAFGGVHQITRNHIDGGEFIDGSWAIRCSGGGSPGAGDNIVTGFYRWLGTGYGIAATTGCYGLGPTTVGVR
jgi:nitrous oxidase accessory protein NosD